MFDKQININQKNFLLILYVVILVVFGPAIYWVSNSRYSLPFTEKSEEESVETRISSGDRILVTAHNSSAKQAGIEAYAQGKYVTAGENFSLALKNNRNDPEARIYLNNSTAVLAKNPYRIGVSVPIGGNLGVAEEILRGVAQAQEEINRNGGINGKLLLVEIANDDNEPDLAVEIANEFVRDSKILAVVGHNSSNASIAAAPVYQEANLVMITPTSSAEDLSNMGNYIFRTVPSTRALTDTLANYVVNTARKTNIGICFDSNAQASISFKENFIWAVYDRGGKISPIDCDFSAADFNGENIPSQAISKGVDGLLLAPSVRKVDKAMQVVAANDDRLTLLGNHSLNTYATLKQGQNAVNGMVLSVPSYPQSGESSFNRDAKKLWGGSVNWRTAMAYDATKTLSEALALGTDRKTLQQTLANPEFEIKGATTDVSFLPSGDRNMRGSLIKIQPGNKSGTGYDFVALSDNLSTTISSPVFATTNPQSPSKQTNKSNRE